MSVFLEEIEALLERHILCRLDSLEETLSTVVSDIGSLADSITTGFATFVETVDTKLATIEALLRSNTDNIDPASLQPAVTELRQVVDAISAAQAAVDADTTGDLPPVPEPPVEPPPDTPPADGTTV